MSALADNEDRLALMRANDRYRERCKRHAALSRIHFGDIEVNYIDEKYLRFDTNP